MGENPGRGNGKNYGGGKNGGNNRGGEEGQIPVFTAPKALDYFILEFIGGDDETRTRDLLRDRQAF